MGLKNEIAKFARGGGKGAKKSIFEPCLMALLGPVQTEGGSSQLQSKMKVRAKLWALRKKGEFEFGIAPHFAFTVAGAEN